MAIAGGGAIQSQIAGTEGTRTKVQAGGMMRFARYCVGGISTSWLRQEGWIGATGQAS